MSKPLVEIMNGAKETIQCVRMVLTIIAIIVMVFNVMLLKSVRMLDIIILSAVCFVANIVYLILVLRFTSLQVRFTTILKTIIAYVLLVIAAAPSIILFMYGGDLFSLRYADLLLFLGSDNLPFPIAMVVFYTVIFWLSMIQLRMVQKKYVEYVKIKEEYGK